MQPSSMNYRRELVMGLWLGAWRLGNKGTHCPPQTDHAINRFMNTKIIKSILFSGEGDYSRKRAQKFFLTLKCCLFTHPCLPISMNFYGKSLSLSKTIGIIKKNLSFHQLIDYSTLVLFLVYINAKHLICSDAFPIIKHLISLGFSILHSDLE